MTLSSVANLPTRFGDFRIAAFDETPDGKEHVAIIRGDVRQADRVLTRIHSECLTGDVLGSLRCDCRGQLQLALERIGALPAGLVLYLRQEGRGIGLRNKIRAYALQDRGLDTVEANVALGFQDDERDFQVAADMLGLLGVRSIHLMTNNPLKVESMQRHGIQVGARVPHQIPPTVHNHSYLQTKARRSGHFLHIPELEPRWEYVG